MLSSGSSQKKFQKNFKIFKTGNLYEIYGLRPIYDAVKKSKCLIIFWPVIFDETDPFHRSTVNGLSIFEFLFSTKPVNFKIIGNLPVLCCVGRY